LSASPGASSVPYCFSASMIMRGPCQFAFKPTPFFALNVGPPAGLFSVARRRSAEPLAERSAKPSGVSGV